MRNPITPVIIRALRANWAGSALTRIVPLISTVSGCRDGLKRPG
jgi:hypothetical protein